MNALDLIGWWFGLSLVAGIGVGRVLAGAGAATVPAQTNLIKQSRASR